MKTQTVPDRPALPWWRVGMVWLVLAGPVAVIAAGIATAVIAVNSADTVVRVPPQAAGAYEPAQKARNHAATPQQPR
ncbi:MAG TPA: nitrogen fixation protein FixH [Methylibium sp.]|nr:nitrogen fixation protein FixH [Methylibium sp.]